MKARPRRAEREVAAHLSQIFQSIGYGPVERIPVLGRTGPDLTFNEMGLVIDVKSRLEVPKSTFANGLVQWGELVGVPLWHLPELAVSYALVVPRKACKTVDDYYAHMHEWTLQHRPADISCLVLHRPAMPFGKAMFIIHSSQREEFISRWNKSKPQL
jgi:hypothetical protein